MPYGSTRKYRDNRTGRYRKHRPHESNYFFTADTLTAGLANFAFKTSTGMAEVAADFATELVEYAVANAPWEDRTGDARRGLQAEASIDDDSLEVDLFHTVDYGIWLEVRWGGRYAIIIPTVDAIGPKLLEKMNGMISDIYYP
jgi:hypothetical protein